MNKDRVKDVMTTLVVMVYPNDPIQQVASRLVRNRISGAPVIRDGKVVGIVSEVDIAHALLGPANVDKGLATADVLSFLLRTVPAEHKHVRVAADVMSTPVVTIGPKASLIKAAQLLDRHGIKRLPVVDEEGFLVGILSRGDLVRALTRTDGEIRQEVQEALAVLGPDVFEDIHIDIDDGVVALSGTADRLSTRNIAVEMASRVAGVVEVTDRLAFTVDDTSMKHLASVSADHQGRDPWAVGSLVKEA
jgi:CBS domain-containing protein